MLFMKKILSFVMIAATFVAVSCNPEEGGKGGKGGSKALSVEATQPSFDGVQAAWPEGTQIMAFADGTSGILTGAGAGVTTTFEGEGGNAKTVYLLTPYCEDAVAEGNAITAVFPAEQEAVAGGVSASAVVAVAEVAGGKADFKAACGLLKFTVNTSYNIRTVAITPKGSEKAAGKAKITVAATPKVSVVDGESTVTVAPVMHTENLANGVYYASVIPQTYVDGFEVVMTDEFGRTAKVTSQDFLKVAAGKVIDLGTITEGIEFKVPRLTQKPWDLGAKGNGETVTTTLSANVKSTTKVDAPAYIAVKIEGKTLSATFAANDANDVRFGKICAEVVTDEGPATVEILTAQSFKGGAIFYDSLTGPELDPDWKGNGAVGRGEWKYGEGYLQMVGTGDVYNNYAALYQGKKFSWKNTAGNCVSWVSYIDVDMDGGCGGIVLFNKAGYNGSAYDFKSEQNYLIFVAGTNGAEGLGYYCANCKSFNAMDSPIKAPDWDNRSEWVRVETGNFERRTEAEVLQDSPDYPEWLVRDDWILKGVWALNADDSGILQKAELLHHGAMWFWNDSPVMDNTPGYCGIFAKDTSPTKFRNFVIAVAE